MIIKKSFGISLMVMALLAASPVHAQEQGNISRSGETTQNQNRTGGGERTREQGHDATTDKRISKVRRYKVGDFVINPAVSVSEYYDDNIFYARITPDEDWITVIAPSITLKSDWDEHELNVHGGATIGRYRQHDEEDYEDYFAGLDGHIDLAPKSRIFGGLQYNKLHEGRESPDDVNGTKPTEYDLLDAFVGGQHEFDDFGIKLGATLQEFDFDDVTATGGTINNDDRDRREYEIGGRVVRPWKYNIKLFLQGLFGQREYDDAFDDAGFNRDSDGLGLAAGALYKPHKNLSVEVLAGWLWQDYDDPNFSDIEAPDFGTIVTWKPTPLTSVNFTVDRRVRETTLAGASGYVSTRGDIGIHRDLTQELSLNAGASYTDNEYEGVERTDDLISFYANNRYYFTPQIYGGLGYNFLHRDSDQAGQDFFDNRVMLRVGTHLNRKKPLAGLSSGFGTNGSVFAGLHQGHGTHFAGLDGPRGAGGTVTADFGDHGGVTGIFGGYDHFFGRWFMGAEADFETSHDFDWEHIEQGGRVFDIERGTSYGLALRGGYRQPNNVAYYGRAGLQWTHFDTDYATGGQDFENDESELGFRFGGGLEAPVIGSSGFVRMDYSYATYEDFGINLPGGTDLFDTTEALMRLGLVFRSGLKESDVNSFHDFSGAYLGAQIGYGGFAARNRGARNAPAILTVDRASHGGTGGIFGGYGFQPFGDIYLGIEGEAEISYADWNIERDPTGRVYDAQKDWTVGGALRAGYIFNDTVLLYGRLGGVISQFDTDYTRGNQDVNQKDTLNGIRYGGGMEVAATEKLFVRMDYSYTNYEDYEVNYVTGLDTFDPTETMMRVGVGFRF